MEENFMDAANAETAEEAVEESSPASEEQEEANEPAGAPAAESVSATKAFSDRLNKMVSQRMDDFVAGMGLTNEYTGEAVRTKADYDAYHRMKQLDESGDANPASTYRYESRDAEVQELRDKVRDTELQSDPVKGTTYKALRDEVMELVDYCRGQGIECSVDSAFSTILANRYFDLTNQASEAATKSAVEKINNNANATPGPLSGETTEETGDYSKMSSADFKDAYNKVVFGG